MFVFTVSQHMSIRIIFSQELVYDRELVGGRASIIGLFVVLISTCSSYNSYSGLTSNALEYLTLSELH